MNTRGVITEFLDYVAEEQFRLKMMGPERFIEEFMKKHPNIETNCDQTERLFRQYQQDYNQLKEKTDVKKLNWFQKFVLKRIVGWDFQK